VRLPCVEQDTLRGGRLSSIDVRSDTKITNMGQFDAETHGFIQCFIANDAAL
jgi:hypothetical protein